MKKHTVIERTFIGGRFVGVGTVIELDEAKSKHLTAAGLVTPGELEGDELDKALKAHASKVKAKTKS